MKTKEPIVSLEEFTVTNGKVSGIDDLDAINNGIAYTLYKQGARRNAAPDYASQVMDILDGFDIEKELDDLEAGLAKNGAALQGLMAQSVPNSEIVPNEHDRKSTNALLLGIVIGIGISMFFLNLNAFLK